MAKKKIDTDTSKKQTLARVTRTEAYAEKVRLLFAKAVNEILELNKQIPTLSDGEMFSFDAQSQKMQTKVENVLRQLHSAATLAIKQGVKLEWDQANEEVDKLLASVLGKRVLSDDRFNALTGRNTAALNAFLDRSERGMNLSDRVWKPVRQLRDEMEVALTISIGEGESAANMSRKVREYLNDPDLMFRRFRYKAGEEKIFDENGEQIGTKIIWGKKWKKRVKGADGKIHFIDYDKDSYKDEYTGKGYYKSSAQNAMRVTRTETNIAYRRADHARWNDLDFVLGVRVQVSKSHKHSEDGKVEICEKLQGDYPKDFIFDGWHPQCFCFATPIMMDESEMQKYADALAEGKKYTPKGKKITDYPQGFKDWVQDNSEKLLDAHDNGRDPYFVRNNYGVIDKIIKGESFDEPVKKTPAEIAKERHAARTPEQEQIIRNKAKERQKAIKAANQYISDFEDFNDVDISALQDAYKHADWDKVKQEAIVLAQKKRQIIESAIDLKNELEGISDVDTQAAENALKTGKLTSVQMEANALQKVKDQIGTLSYLDDPLTAAKATSLSDVIAVNAAVQDKIENKWAGLSLQEQQKKLKFEIYDYLGSPTDKYGAQAKYPNTWKISQAAYMKQLDKVNDQIEWQEIQAKQADLISFVTKSPIYKKDLADLQIAVTGKDKAAANTLISKLLIKRSELTAKRNGKTKAGDVDENGVGSQFTYDAAAYSKARKDAAIWAQTPAEADAKLRSVCGDVWRNATEEEKDAIHGYTNSYHNVNEPLRGLHYYGSTSDTKLGLDRIPKITKIISKSYYDFDIWLNRFDDEWSLKKFGLNPLNFTEDQVKALVGSTGTEGAVWSAGDAKGKGLSGGRRFIYNIYCPKGTRMMYAEPFSSFGHGDGRNWDGTRSQGTFGSEAEVIIQRNTTYRVTKVETPSENGKGYYYIDVEIIAQDVLEFPYAGGVYPFK